MKHLSDPAHLARPSRGRSPVLLAAALCLCASSAFAQEIALDDATYQRMVDEMVVRHILPRYEAFQEATAELATAAHHCSDDPQGLTPAFNTALDAWMAVQQITFGPAELDMRAPRIHYWPDRRNTGNRQLDQLLAERPDDLTEASLAAGSVALQGFPALERVVFVASEDGLDDFECLLIAGIADNLATMGNEIVAEWSAPDGDAAMIANAGAPDSFYPSARDVAADIYQGLYEQLQIVMDQKLDRPLNDDLESATPRRAELWRSGRSLSNIAINLESALDLYAGGDGYGFEDALTENGNAEMASRLRQILENAIATAEAINAPLFDAVADEAMRPHVEHLRDLVDQAREMVGAELGMALGLQMGFNSLDGD